MSASAVSCRGRRTPTVSSPARTSPGTSWRAAATIVSAPGQKASARSLMRGSASAASVKRWMRSARSAMCTMSGSNVGRPFASKIRATAGASNAFAPSPYTVSVGKATRPPARMIAAPRGMDSAAECGVRARKRSVITLVVPRRSSARRDPTVTRPCVRRDPHCWSRVHQRVAQRVDDQCASPSRDGRRRRGSPTR